MADPAACPKCGRELLYGVKTDFCSNDECDYVVVYP